MNPILPYENSYEWVGEEPEQILSEEESKRFEVGLSYQSLTASLAWRDILETLEASVLNAESEALSVKAGEPYEKRVESMIVWQQRKLLRRVVEQRAHEMMQYTELAIKEGINGYTSSYAGVPDATGGGQSVNAGSPESNPFDDGIPV